MILYVIILYVHLHIKCCKNEPFFVSYGTSFSRHSHIPHLGQPQAAAATPDQRAPDLIEISQGQRIALQQFLGHLNGRQAGERMWFGRLWLGDISFWEKKHTDDMIS